MRSLSKGCTRRTEVRKIPAGCGVAGENPVLLVLNGIIQTQYERQHSFDLGFRDFTLGTNVRYSTGNNTTMQVLRKSKANSIRAADEKRVRLSSR